MTSRASIVAISSQARPGFRKFAGRRPAIQTGMHNSVGISMGPWLVTKTIAANASVGHQLSRWAAITPNPLRTLSHRNCKQFATSSKGRRHGERCFTCDMSGAGGVAESSKVDRRLMELAFTRRQVGLGLGLWDSAREGRHSSSSLVCGARRGFLSELQSLRDEKEDAADSAPVEFESPVQIILYPDPRLRNKNKRVTVFDEKLQQLVKEMFEVMYNTDGVGLAAPQVGANVRLMLYNPEGEKGQGQEYILINPKIVKYGKQRDVFTEGCLSFLKLEADVERPLTVRVEAQDIRGKKFGLTLKGWQARIFQHEYDHLDGILYHDRMTPAEVDKIRAGLVELEEEYERRTGQPAPERVK